MKRSYRIVGVMGGGRASAADIERAYELGRRIAREGWILLNGGRAAGIMDASARGAAENGGTTVGILPDETDAGASEYIHIPVLTGMGSGRNIVNVLSSHVVVACPGGPGTISEIALALKYHKTVILLHFALGDLFADYRRRHARRSRGAHPQDPGRVSLPETGPRLEARNPQPACPGAVDTPGDRNYNSASLRECIVNSRINSIFTAFAPKLQPRRDHFGTVRFFSTG